MHYIEFSGVTKGFARHAGRQLLRVRMANLFKPKERFQALKNISFRIQEGESVALIGHNGAGKSTLLSLVAGLSKPDEGTVEVHGRVAALLELGSGFHGDLTGRENLHLNASLIGLKRKRTEEILDAIIEFSELGEFIDEPLRTYSSGMVMRLAFAIAVNVDPDFLLVDEVLVVGDQGFQEKSFGRIREFRRQGKSLLTVSHSPGIVRALCDRAIWLDHGKKIMDDTADRVLTAYEEAFHGKAVT